MFCTFFIGILDLCNGHLQYCNAGHNAPVVIAPSCEVKFMEVVPNLPLGLFGGFPYEGQECDIDKGTTIFLYTDGVTEAEDNTKALYSDERLLSLLDKERNSTPQPIVDVLLTDIDSHVNGAEQSDDITIMCVHYK